MGYKQLTLVTSRKETKCMICDKEIHKGDKCYTLSRARASASKRIKKSFTKKDYSICLECK